MELCKCVCKQLTRPSRVLRVRELSTTALRYNRTESVRASDGDDQEKTTHFGFKTIRESEKEKEGLLSDSMKINAVAPILGHASVSDTFVC